MFKNPMRLLLVVMVIAVGWLLVSCSTDTTQPTEPTVDSTQDISGDFDKATIISSFIVHGDSHSGFDERNPDVPEVHPALVSEFTLRAPDYLFHVGDVVDILSTLDNPYTEAHAPVWGNLMAGIPTYAALGNHDDEDQFFAYFPNVTNRRYYVTDPASGCLFIFLDIPTCSDYTNLDIQEEFLIDTLSNRRLKDLQHRFVFFHVPPFTLGFRGDCAPAALWDEMLESYGVDVVFSGHTHAYEHFMGPCYDVPDLPIWDKKKPVIGTHPVHYVVTGRSGAYEHSPVESPTCGDCDNCIMSEYDVHNYVEVAIGELGYIHVTARDHNGSLLEYFRIID